MNSFKRGMSLMTVLLGMTVLLLLLFTMAEASVFHLQFATSLDSRQEAKNLAESAVNEALAEFLGNDQYGKTPVQVLVPGDGDPTKNYGIVSFGADSRVPSSLNNIGSLNQVQGSTNHAVPGNTVHIVGRGRVGDSTSTVEAIYYRPPFPKALSASGPIHAIGTVVQGSVPGTPPAFPVPAGQSVPGCIQTNCALRGANPALKLEQCAISGDAAAVGDVGLDAATRVEGEVRQNGAPQTIPTIDVLARINSIKGAASTEILTGTIGSKTLNWFAGCTDPLLTINGDLELKNGVLWTTGDLTVTGGIKGQGLVLCGGKLEVQTGTQLAADNLVALAAVGDVKLNGQGRASYYFQGIVYTGGNFHSQDLTVIGSVLAQSTDPTKGGIDLNNVNVVQTPASVAIAQAGMMTIVDRSPATPGLGTQGPVYQGLLAPQSPAPTTGSHSSILCSLTPTAASVLAGAAPVDCKYNFSMRNLANSALAPVSTFDQYGKNQGPSGDRVPAPSGTPSRYDVPINLLVRYIPGFNRYDPWYLPLRTAGGSNDCIQQIDYAVGESLSTQFTHMLFPPVNSLLAPGERSRVLSWRCY